MAGSQWLEGPSALLIVGGILNLTSAVSTGVHRHLERGVPQVYFTRFKGEK